jgi:hypothetical protein
MAAERPVMKHAPGVTCGRLVNRSWADITEGGGRKKNLYDCMLTRLADVPCSLTVKTDWLKRSMMIDVLSSNEAMT